MNNTKENLDVQRFTVNDILCALLCLEDKEVKEVLTSNFKPVDIGITFSSQENFDKMIRTLENYIEFYEIAIRGFRQLADILQVPTNQEG